MRLGHALGLRPLMTAAASLAVALLPVPAVGQPPPLQQLVPLQDFAGDPVAAVRWAVRQVGVAGACQEPPEATEAALFGVAMQVQSRMPPARFLELSTAAGRQGRASQPDRFDCLRARALVDRVLESMPASPGWTQANVAQLVNAAGLVGGADACGLPRERIDAVRALALSVLTRRPGVAEARRAAQDLFDERAREAGRMPAVQVACTVGVPNALDSLEARLRFRGEVAASIQQGFVAGHWRDEPKPDGG